MEQTTLTSAQKTVIETVAGEPQLAGFYLTGGTALAAYHLHHRVSDDLDFFDFEAPDMIFLHGFIENLKNKVNARKVRYERRYDRSMFFFDLADSELKVEFTKYFLLQTAKLEDLRRDAETKFGVKIGGIFLGGELAKVGRIEALPKTLKPFTVDELKEFFSRQIKGLSSEVLE